MPEIIEIVVITYAFIEVMKQIRNFKNESIPAIACVIGACLGLVSNYVIPDFPASNIMTAIAIGVTSGLASTGAHQIVKQCNKWKEEKNEET